MNMCVSVLTDSAHDASLLHQSTKGHRHVNADAWRADKGFEYPHVRHRHISQGDELAMWKQLKQIQDAGRLRRIMHGNQTRSDPEFAKKELSSLRQQESEEVLRLRPKVDGFTQ